MRIVKVGRSVVEAGEDGTNLFENGSIRLRLFVGHSCFAFNTKSEWKPAIENRLLNNNWRSKFELEAHSE